MNQINESFWDERYLSNQTGWDISYVSTPIKEYIDTALDDKDIRILIPGCGNAYEASYLLEKGFKDITLVDISSVLVERLRKRFAGESAIHLVHSNILDFEGEFDLIIEQTFFCTFPPDKRMEVVKHLQGLLHPGGEVIGVLFNENIGFFNHPPFAATEADYRSYFGDYYEIKKMELCRNSIPARQGNELFIELIKK